MLNFLEVLAGVGASRTCSALQLLHVCTAGWISHSARGAPGSVRGRSNFKHGSQGTGGQATAPEQ